MLQEDLVIEGYISESHKQHISHKNVQYAGSGKVDLDLEMEEDEIFEPQSRIL